MSLKVLKNERVIMVDVDDTLVMHSWEGVPVGNRKVNVVDPLFPDETVTLAINEGMVRLVQEELARGSQICVWSQGGYEWATNVVKALDLDIFCDSEIVVLTKPFAYFDDTDVSSWMTDRVYLKPDKAYKNKF